MICCSYFLVFLLKRSEFSFTYGVSDTSGKWIPQLRDGQHRSSDSVKKKKKKNVFSSLSFGPIHYLVVVLLHFSILSICHCSWVVMEQHRSVMSLFVSDLFIIHHLHLLPPILFLVLWFIKTRLHKKQFPLNHRHCGMKIFWSYSIIQETGWGVESGLFEFHSQDILSSKVADLCVTCLFEILKVAKKWNLERFQSLGMWLISEWKSHSYCT